MKYLTSFLSLITISLCLVAQSDTTSLTLFKAIEVAQNETNSAQRIEHNFNSSMWNYKIFRATMKPTVDLLGTLPDFTRAITPQLLPDGTQDFISYNNWNTDLNLRITQALPATGGQIFINSNIQRIINIELEENAESYFTNPISIGFSQELTGFNQFRWLRQTEPMRLEEANREQVEKREELAMQVVQAYFNYLLAQDQLRVAENNLKNNQELFRIAKGRYNLGKIAENDLLQMELSVLDASITVENSLIALQRNRNDLFSMLNITDDVQLRLIIPEDIQTLNVDPEHALQEALSNRKDIIGFQRRLIEADMMVAQARADKRLQLTLFGSFGLNQTGSTFQEAYTDPLDQERLRLGVAIPIYDGSTGRSNYKIAQSERDVTNSDIAELRRGFERDVKLKAREIRLLDLQIQTAAKTDTIASRRYEISRQRYMQGKIDITELNLSQRSKDEARRMYLMALQEYWVSYYRLRMLTLYDYRADRRLYKRMEE